MLQEHILPLELIPSSFWFQVAAVNPAGVGEHSPPQIATFNCTACELA